MKLSNTNAHVVGKYGWEGSISALKRAGYDAFDANFCHYLDDSFQDGQWAEDRYLERAREIRALCDKEGIACTQIHAPYAFKAPMWKDQLYEVCFPRVVRSLEIAAALGADVCVVHPLHHFEYRGNEEYAFQLNMEYYKRLLEYAHKFGVRIGIENMWQRDALRGCISHDTCSRAEEFIRYIDTLNDPRAVACLDVGHIDIIHREDCTADVIRALGRDRLHALHIHDNNYKSDDHLLPFHGKLDWNGICTALGEIDYDDDLTFEIGSGFFDNCPDEFYEEKLTYSVKVGRQLIQMIDRARPKK